MACLACAVGPRVEDWMLFRHVVKSEADTQAVFNSINIDSLHG